MDIRSKFALTSSWQASAKLNCLLRVINSSGVILDEPYASEGAQTVTLVQPTSSTKDGAEPSLCYIGIDSAHLKGYSLAAVEIISGSRTVEFYNSPGQNYISTVRGDLEKQEDGTKLYSVQFELPVDFNSPSLSVKLLSLQGRTEVTVKEINVIVSEDYGGTKQQMSSELTSQQRNVGQSSSGAGFDLQQMLQTMGASQGVPPFLKSLASSLQQSMATPTTTPTAGRGNRTSSTGAIGGDGGASSRSSMPVELFQMMDAFKQMMPASPTATASEQTMNEEGEGGEGACGQEEATGNERSEMDVNEQISKVLEERLSALEKRLRGYVDFKISDLEKKLLLKLEMLNQRIKTDHHHHGPGQTNGGCDHCTVSNGVLSSVPLPEDHQLD